MSAPAGSSRPWAFAGGLGVIVAVVLLQNLGDRLLFELLLRAPGIDKLLHFVQYTAICLGVWGLARFAGLAQPAATASAVAATLGIGLLDEVVQGYVARRTMEFADLAVDAAGVLMATALVAGGGRRRLRIVCVLAALAVTAVFGVRTHLLLRDYNRGLLLERSRDFVRAREHYHRALAAGHRSPGLFNSLAWVEVESGVGDPERAVRYAERGLALRPHSGDLLDTYGWALHHAGRSAEALAALRRAESTGTSIYGLHYHLGVVLMALNRAAEARRHFELQRRAFPGAVESRLAAAALARRPGTDEPSGRHESGY